MDAVYSLLSVETIAFEVLGYQISWLELIGTVFNFVCVVLAARRNIWNWPIGLVGVVLFGMLFYQINLYADVLEQVYYLLTGIAGWYLWSRVGRVDSQDNKVGITTNTRVVNLVWVAGIALASILFGWATSNLHVWAATLFPEPADLPYLDAATTMTAFAAQLLMMRRKLESWYLWILVDIVAVGLYWYKGVPFVALLYLLFLVNACYGWWTWRSNVQAGRTVAEKEQLCVA
ncbi:MAG: nicotinamide riboside transporter PnuC [Corynebacterium sp.]|nr:nicotinamide riboside transporter PnuC [Corynebacterium sp.]